jgi:hypothetical protein
MLRCRSSTSDQADILSFNAPKNGWPHLFGKGGGGRPAVLLLPRSSVCETEPRQLFLGSSGNTDVTVILKGSVA